MKKATRRRKQLAKEFHSKNESPEFYNAIFNLISEGKSQLDSFCNEMGRLLIEHIMYMEREQLTGPDYHPSDSNIKKWASQKGSVFLGDQKVQVDRPRIRGPEGEISLQTYSKLSNPSEFSHEVLQKALRGLSGRKYEETVVKTASAFGVSKSSISRHLVEATTKQLKEFQERDLSNFRPFAIFLDSVHRGGDAFIVALGIDLSGQKLNLGFWQGASENDVICKELFNDLEERGLSLSRKIIFVTDGGKGIIKALKDRFGKKLIHQRCTLHKNRNIQCHLPKKYRMRASQQFRRALELTSYQEAKEELIKLKKWLKGINESAAKSLDEALEELLTIHKLKVPALLRKTLHSTNPIESIFSSVRSCERNIKRYRSSKMGHRWLASVLLYAEKKFRTIKGHADIEAVRERIENENFDIDQLNVAA